MEDYTKCTDNDEEYIFKEGVFFEQAFKALLRYQSGTKTHMHNINNQLQMLDIPDAFSITTATKCKIIQINRCYGKSVNNVLQGFPWKSMFGHTNHNNSRTGTMTVSRNNNSTLCRNSHFHRPE